jgi:RES domain-containing protein
VEVYRLSKLAYANELSGRGAAKFGNRWNSKGVEIIYCAGNRSLAMAEVLVHLPLKMLPKDFIMMTIFIPDSMSQKVIAYEELPEGWNVFPGTAESKSFGDIFITENKYGILKVPSAVTKGDYNVLINPFYKDFDRIQIIEKVPFLFDNRFFDI